MMMAISSDCWRFFLGVRSRIIRLWGRNRPEDPDGWPKLFVTTVLWVSTGEEDFICFSLEFVLAKNGGAGSAAEYLHGCRGIGVCLEDTNRVATRSSSTTMVVEDEDGVELTWPEFGGSYCLPWFWVSVCQDVGQMNCTSSLCPSVLFHMEQGRKEVWEGEPH